MNASSAGFSKPARVRLFVVGAIAAMLGMFALAGSSQAAVTPKVIPLDHGQMTLGGPFPDQKIIPAMTAPAPWTLNPSSNGAIVAMVDDNDNSVTVAAGPPPGGGWGIPLLAIVNQAVVNTGAPNFTAVPVPVQLTAPDGLTGTSDPVTGEMTLTGKLRFDIFTATKGTDNINPAIWRIEVPNATLSTEDNGGFIPGTRLGANFAGPGALSAFIKSIPMGTPINGGNPAIGAIVANQVGELWLSSGVATPPGPTGDVINVDNGKLTLGAVFPNNTIIPADTTNGGPYPLRVNTSANGKFRLTPDGPGKVKVAATDFRMPTVGVPNPTNPAQTVPISMEVPNGLAGDWNSSTGALDLTGDLQINIFTGAGEICRINAQGIKWSTGLNAVTPGVPFTNGLTGNGAISASWADLPNGTEINGGDCSTVNSVIHDTGAIWLSQGVATPPKAPSCADEGKQGLWPNCEDIPKKMKITAVQLRPKKHTMRAGGRFMVVVRVVNKGDAAGWVTVKLKVNRKKGVHLRKQVRVKAFANSFGQLKVRFNTNRQARGKYKVTATGAGKKGTSTITVKPAKKKRR